MASLKLLLLGILWHVGHAQNEGSIQQSSTLTLEQARKQLLYPFEGRDLKQLVTRTLHDEPLTFRLPFFGFEFRYIWLHKDGALMFNDGLQDYRPKLKFPIKKIDKPQVEEDPALIAPWFSRQDIPSSVPDAGIYFRVINIDLLDRDNHEQNVLRERIKMDFKDGMIGSSEFEPKYALIATWKNVTYINRRDKDESNLKTNTYQAVIATDEKRTYAMFNYEWITWTSSEDNFDGTKGTAPFIGFNAGNRTRAYEYEPYSQEQRVNRLPKLGFGNGLKGRFYFQIDEEVWPGCCIERDLDVNWPSRPKLTFFPRYGSMLGGTMVNLTGPCFLNPKSIIRCKFDTLTTDGFWRTENYVSCISPPVMYHGYVDLSVSVDNGPYLFLGKYYIQPPDMVEADVVVLNSNDRQEAPEEFILHWNSHKLSWKSDAPVTISLWGYRETNDNYPKLTYIDVLSDEGVRNGINQFPLDLEQFRSRWNWDRLDIIFGFIAVNLSNPESSLSRDIKHSPVLWSSPMPLGWYFRHQWARHHGKTWKSDICDDWFIREKNSDRFPITLFRCPCTLQQAKLDTGRFAPDLQCNEIDRKCETFHKSAYHCVRSGRPAVGGAGQLCCYDDRGELLRTGDTMYAGRPARAFHFGKHPFKQRMMIPALSYWHHDVAPYFFCCKWADGEEDSESCNQYKYWRTSQDCSLYQSPGVASVFGDPHFVTFDRVNYTYNGKGEFVLTKVDSKLHKLDVQGRFEQPLPKRRDGPPINGTRLMAVVAKDNISATVEFRVRPDAARWQYHMYIIVDNEYVYFWDNSMRIQYFKGVTLYQPANVYNMSHIVAMFDSGAGVEVMVENGHMATHIYLPRTYLNNTAGLLGNWTRNMEDDFTSPTGDVIYRPGTKTEFLHNFGNQWRLQEIEDDYVGVSLFYHNGVPFSEYNNATFKPQYEVPTKLPDTFIYDRDTLTSVCSNSRHCEFDFVVTNDIDFAVATKNHENYAQKLASLVREQVVRCPDLPKPRFGRKTDLRYFVGTMVSFICNDGYRLVGYEHRRCRDTGLWSWGVDPECISEADYSRKVAGISLGIALPLLIVGILTCVCLVTHMRRKKNHYTGERGLFNSRINEMKPTNNRNGPPPARPPTNNGKEKLEHDV